MTVFIRKKNKVRLVILWSSALYL